MIKRLNPRQIKLPCHQKGTPDIKVKTLAAAVHFPPICPTGHSVPTGLSFFQREQAQAYSEIKCFVKSETRSQANCSITC